MLSGLLQNASTTVSIVASVAIMLILAFLMTRITKLLKLPNVTAYIVTGILIGPFCLGIVPQQIIDGMDFLSDIALAFIAFSAGEFFRFKAIKKNGSKVIIITLAETVAAMVFVFVSAYWMLGLDLPFSIVLATLAAATAPASTMMTIRETGAKGDFVNTLFQIVVLDDVIGLIAYNISISIAASLSFGESVNVFSIIKPIIINIGVMALGGVFGMIMKPLLQKKRSTDNRLIITIAFLFAFCGICAVLDISPLLGCMSMGAIYINLTEDDKLFKQVNYFSPPILLLFFVRSGMSFDLGALFSSSAVIGSASLIVIGIVYFISRILGKYTGAFLGCLSVKKPAKTRNYIGLALIPQAGIAIGLAAIGARTLGGEAGNTLLTVILASSVLYELVGPACAKLSLYLSGSYTDKLEDIVTVDEISEDGKKKNSVELLIERIQKIQETMPKQEISEEEQAFTNAAEEQYENIYAFRNRRFRRK